MPDKRTIIISGCSRGLGRELFKAYYQLGHRVFGCATSGEKLAALEKELGCTGRLTQVDVTDASAVEAWVARVVEEAGSPDYVLNNAALINENVPFWEVPTEDFDRIIDVNLKGVANLCRAALPSMLKAGKGILVNFSSGYGHFAAPGVAPYCCTKFGIEGFTQALSKELPDGLAAIPMSPGIINTEMLQTTFGANNAATHETPQQWVTHAANYILSLTPEHNGQSLRVPQ